MRVSNPQSGDFILVVPIRRHRRSATAPTDAALATPYCSSASRALRPSSRVMYDLMLNHSAAHNFGLRGACAVLEHPATDANVADGDADFSFGGSLLDELDIELGTRKERASKVYMKAFF